MSRGDKGGGQESRRPTAEPEQVELYTPCRGGARSDATGPRGTAVLLHSRLYQLRMLSEQFEAQNQPHQALLRRGAVRLQKVAPPKGQRSRGGACDLGNGPCTYVLASSPKGCSGYSCFSVQKSISEKAVTC